MACSTCHVIVAPEWFEKLDDASEDEEDMLDLAFGLTATSRLGCQLIMTEALDGLTAQNIDTLRRERDSSRPRPTATDHRPST